MERITSYGAPQPYAHSRLETTITASNFSLSVFYFIFSSLFFHLSLFLSVCLLFLSFFFFWLCWQTRAGSLFELIIPPRNDEGENVLFSSLLVLLSARWGFVRLFRGTMRNSAEVRLFFISEMGWGWVFSFFLIWFIWRAHWRWISVNQEMRSLQLFERVSDRIYCLFYIGDGIGKLTNLWTRTGYVILTRGLISVALRIKNSIIKLLKVL